MRVSLPWSCCQSLAEMPWPPRMRVIGVKEWEETVLGAWSSISVLYSGNHEASPAKYSAFFLLVTSATASNSQLGGCLPLLLQLRMPETPSTTADPSCRHRHTSTVRFRALWAGMMLVQIQKTLTDSFPPSLLLPLRPVASY